MMKRILLGILILSMAMFAGCGGGGGSDGASDEVALAAAKGPAGGGPTESTPVSGQGIVPMAYEGNFVSSADDDQVCYDMSALGYIGEVNEEMRGVKIDPPADYENAFVSVVLSADGKLLDWETINAKMLAFIVKGGPNYNVYNYVPYDYTSDSGLGAPFYKKSYPQISHYNFCYQLDLPEGDQGCTPGYWRNHADRWLGVAPGDDFDATFGVELFDPNITLGQAISNPQTFGTFAFHAVAALLNSYGGVPNGDGTTVDYPYTTAEVLQMVQDAVANGTIEETKDELAAANELGCPLSGTSAVKVQ
jgi:hypothetical protein